LHGSPPCAAPVLDDVVVGEDATVLLAPIFLEEHRQTRLPQKPLSQQAGSLPQRALAGILEKTGADWRILRGNRRGRPNSAGITPKK